VLKKFRVKNFVLKKFRVKNFVFENFLLENFVLTKFRVIKIRVKKFLLKYPKMNIFKKKINLFFGVVTRSRSSRRLLISHRNFRKIFICFESLSLSDVSFSDFLMIGFG